VRLRRRVYAVLEGGHVGDRRSQLVHFGLCALIIASVTAVILESVPALNARFGRLFISIEITAGVVFTIEYALRLWSAVEHAPLRGQSPWQARWRFAREPAMIIDLIAIISFFVAFVAPDELRVLLIFRLIRFFKLARYSPGMRSLQEAIVQEKRALLACLMILGGLMIVAASAMHLAEQAAQPDKFATIPDAMWWAIITLTTVGYGDVVPITPLGKVIAGITALFGLVMLALPVGIIATSFSEVIRRREFVITWAMLARVPLFQRLEPDSLAELLSIMHSRMAEAGEVIMRRGEAADRIYIVASGSVEVLHATGREVRGEGQVFGHVFGDQGTQATGARSATVKALERTRLLALTRADILAIAENDPALRAAIEAG
jgi:voltage-gated potassium channel